MRHDEPRGERDGGGENAVVMRERVQQHGVYHNIRIVERQRSFVVFIASVCGGKVRKWREWRELGGAFLAKHCVGRGCVDAADVEPWIRGR